MKHKTWYRYTNAIGGYSWRYPIAAGIIALVVFLAYCNRAGATECPQGVPKCKVLVLTPDMEQALTGPNMILDVAEWGNRAGLGSAVQFFKKAIADAPAGDVKNPEVKKPDEKK